MRIDIRGQIGRLGDLDYTAVGLTAHADRCALDLILVGNVDAASDTVGGENQPEPDANYFCAQLCAHEPRFCPLYWLRPHQPDCNPYAVAGAFKTEAFAGVVLAPELNDFAATDAALDEFVRFLPRVDAAALVLVGERERSSPAAVYALARRHPKTSFILSGAGRVELRRETAEILQTAQARGDAQLCVDTTLCDPDNAMRLIETCGALHVLLGTEAGLADRAAQEDQAALVHALAEALDDVAFEQVTGGNALRVFPRLAARVAAPTAAR